MPDPTPPRTSQLPADADGLLKLAAQSMFDTLANAAMGMFVIDRAHRIVWISEGYKQFLPALEREEADFVGRRVEEVVPNTLMAQVVDTGQAMLVDLTARLRRLERSTCPFDPPPPRPQARDAHWVTPKLVGEVMFGEWTRDAVMRHPSWRGLRPDKAPSDVALEESP